EARLLARLELFRRTQRALQEHVAQLPADGLGEQQQRAAGQISEHVHEDGGDDLLRIADQARHLFQPRDVDLGHRYHDAAVRELRQGRGGVTRTDVRHPSYRVELQRFQITAVFHAL